MKAKSEQGQHPGGPGGVMGRWDAMSGGDLVINGYLTEKAGTDQSQV